LYAYRGLVGVGGFVPSTGLQEHIDPGTMAIVFGGNGFFGYVYSDSSGTPKTSGLASPGDTLTWWSTYHIKDCPDTKSIDQEAVLRDLRERHGNWRLPVIQKIINSVNLETMYPVWTTPELPTWHRDGLMLIGDAAHTLPPTSGQGSSQALEDVESFALFLSHYLKENQSRKEEEPAASKLAIKQAAEKHMALRRPRIKRILDRAKQMNSKKQNLNIFEEFFFYFILYIICELETPLPLCASHFQYAESVSLTIDSFFRFSLLTTWCC
jgi:2-polyprenyl-6-methoxyphenol hydroxylase-like FAD-dependent oxidoreductase